MATIALDAMGGDNAPQVVVEGARLAFERFVSFNVNFLGNPADRWSRFFAHAFAPDAGSPRPTTPTT